MNPRRLLITGGSGFIGANLIRELQVRYPQDEVLNLDIAPSKDKENNHLYRQCDILDKPAVMKYFEEFKPTHVVHLAARTDMLGATVNDYAMNHIGTENIAAAVKQTPSIRNVVFTSSQYVVGPGKLPVDDFDLRPHTIYGESKVLSEKAVRDADVQCDWTIVRPTNVWGRWHPRYPTEFWRVLKQGRYLHPGGRKVTRCYAYVGTVVDQIIEILAREDGSLKGRVFYVGDEAIDLFEWTNAFSKELTGRPVKVVPSFILQGIGKIGDVVIAAGGKFPLFSSRFRSMTEDYLTPMEPTFAALGPSRYTLEQGVHETVAWLRSEDPFWK